MRPAAVIKIGGSLDACGALPALCRAVGRIGRSHALIVVPGGGAFADRVRDACRRYPLGDTAAHRMALLAMDQYAHLLARLIPGGALTARVSSACRLAALRRPAVLLPSAPLSRCRMLPHSWRVTSDTIAAWVAHRARCPGVVLVKDVDGLFPAWPAEGRSTAFDREMTVDELARHRGGVDAYLARFLASAKLETWIVNGRFPGRLKELLERGHTAGTRILRS